MAEEAILGFLEKNEEIKDSGEFAAERNIDHTEIVNVIKSLHGFRYVDAEVTVSVSMSLSLQWNCLECPSDVFEVCRTSRGRLGC